MSTVTITPQTTYFEISDSLRYYFYDIKDCYPLETKYENRLIKKYQKTKDQVEKEKIKNEIISSNLRFALAMARKWATNDNLMDLISEANMAMVEALEHYKVEKSKDCRFTSFAVHYIRRAINLYLMRSGVVRKKNSQKTYHIISQATNKFMQKEHKEPTHDELINFLEDEYGIEFKNNEDVNDYQFTRIEENSSKDDFFSYSMVEYNNVSATINEYENTSERDFIKQMTYSALTCLTEKEQIVIKYYFGIDCDRNYELQEIAEKMSYTTERVRQIKNRALQKMKNAYNVLIEQI